MDLLLAFASIRTPALDALMSAITRLGEEAVFLVVALLVYWCVDKNKGYYLMTVGFTGTVLNQFLKLLFRIPRPWIQNPDLTIVESARAGATGYSFPSGHTQSAVGTFGALGHMSRRRWCKVLFWAAAVLVPVSRMYLGVHTPLDVGVSAVIALALVFLLPPFFEAARRRPRLLRGLFAAMLALSAAYVLFVELWPFPADLDMENYRHGVKTAYTLLGAVAGVNLVHWADERWIRFDTRAPLLGQALKLIGGLAVVLLLRTALKAPFLTLFGGHYAADALRYFLVVAAAGCLWPLTFPFFARLGQGAKDGGH